MPRSVPEAAGILALGSALLVQSQPVQAHGFAGSRFFPATIATDDPFVADKLSLPTVSTILNSARMSLGARPFGVNRDRLLPLATMRPDGDPHPFSIEFINGPDVSST